MSDDLVERLNSVGRSEWSDIADLLAEANAEITRLRALNVELVGALKPFAEIGSFIPTKWGDHESHWTGHYGEITVGELREAARVFVKAKGEA